MEHRAYLPETALTEHSEEKRVQMAQNNGVVKWFNNSNGYGFLGHESGADVLVHYSSVFADGYKSLKEGDRVTFDVI